MFEFVKVEIEINTNDPIMLDVFENNFLSALAPVGFIEVNPVNAPPETIEPSLKILSDVLSDVKDEDLNTFREADSVFGIL